VAFSNYSSVLTVRSRPSSMTEIVLWWMWAFFARSACDSERLLRATRTRVDALLMEPVWPKYSFEAIFTLSCHPGGFFRGGGGKFAQMCVRAASAHHQILRSHATRATTQRFTGLSNVS